MNLTPCPHCAGFVPDALAACPHCDAALKPAARQALAKAAVGGAMAMTLMACYGAGYYGDEADWPTNVDQACSQVLPLPSTNGNAYAAEATDDYQASNALTSPCASSSGPERVFAYDPGAAAGQTGQLTILWDSPTPHSVYVVGACGQTASLACGAPVHNGRIDMDVSQLGALTIVVDSTGYYDGDAFELQVVFTPEP